MISNNSNSISNNSNSISNNSNSISNNSNSINNKPNYYLLFSTSTFIFPILYAAKKGNALLSISTGLALLGSLNYLRKPKPGYRRTIDLITSNSSCFVYIFYGLKNIIGFWPFSIGWSNLFLMIYFYKKSYTNFYLQEKSWIYYHISFHLFTTFSKMYVIYFV
jgi:hypothetical protein